ncbi:MAG TPA: hypothetical protein VIY29_17665, partial [Ktedonobacteraceae bacterium]
MKKTLEQEIQRVVASMEEQHEPETETETPEENEPEAQLPGQEDPSEIQDIYVLVVRERAEPEETPEHIVETTLTPQKTRTTEAFDPGLMVAGTFFVCLALACLALQVFLLLNPPIATVTIVPITKLVTLNGTLHLGRLLSSITISQEATTPTTGHGHWDAQQARGAITFYNGQFHTISVPAGTILTGSSGVPIATDQDAVIPAAAPNPPIFGNVTVAAHAMYAGNTGNIPAFDINQMCCATSVIAKNTQAFDHGQDARDYQTVTRGDIDTTVLPLKTTLAHSINGAFHGQLTQGELLQLLPCTPTTTANHRIGQEATMVTVSVSETCRAVAYHTSELLTKATDLLAQQALHTLATNYRLIGTVHVSITQAAATSGLAPATPTLRFSCQGTWVYTLSPAAQQRIKELIAGKARHEALTLLLSVPGIEAATLEGEDRTTRLPKSLDALHLRMIIPT